MRRSLAARPMPPQLSRLANSILDEHLRGIEFARPVLL
jgi:hypothetical protein